MNTKLFNVIDSHKSIVDHINESDLADARKEKLSTANVLLVAEEEGEYKKGLFWAGAYYLCEFLNQYDKRLNCQICADDASYKEIEQRADWENIATIIVTSAIGQLVADAIWDYISRRRASKLDNVHVNFSMKLSDKKKQITYSGPAELFKKTMGEAIKKILK